MCRPYFSTVRMPMPGIASSSAAVAGRASAMARSAWSVKMRNAGTPSLPRLGQAPGAQRLFHTRYPLLPARASASASPPSSPRLSSCASALPAARRMSFMMNSIGVVSSAARPAGVSLTVRYGICLPSFSKTASDEPRQAGPRHRSEHVFEGIAADLTTRKQLGVQLPRRFPLARAQGRQHLEERRPLRLRGRAEALGHAIRRSAEIADPAGRLAVGKVAEVTHQSRHAALVGFGIPDHQVDLRPLVFAVGDVGFAPLALAGAYVLGVVHAPRRHGSTASPAPCRTGPDPSASASATRPSPPVRAASGRRSRPAQPRPGSRARRRSRACSGRRRSASGPRGWASHRARLARSPGNTPRGCPAGRCESPCGYRVCRSPSRTRSSPPSPRSFRPETPPARAGDARRRARRDTPPWGSAPRARPPRFRPAFGWAYTRCPAGAPRPTTVRSASAGLRDGAASTTSIAMLARRKPWMNRAARTSPNCSAMSSCTSGVAVAVSAITGAGRNIGRYWPSMR